MIGVGDSTVWGVDGEHLRNMGGYGNTPAFWRGYQGVIGVLAGGLLATLGRTRGGWGLLPRRLGCRWAGWSQHMGRTLVLLEDGWG